MASSITSTRPVTVNVIVVIIGLTLFGLALWGVTGLGVSTTGESRDVHVPWVAHALAGALALAGAFAGQRWHLRSVGQILLVAAGIVLIGALKVFHAAGPWAVLTLALPGIALLLVTPFLEPMPPPRPMADSQRSG
jgi:hypothetical protein